MVSVSRFAPTARIWFDWLGIRYPKTRLVPVVSAGIFICISTALKSANLTYGLIYRTYVCLIIADDASVGFLSTVDVSLLLSLGLLIFWNHHMQSRPNSLDENYQLELLLSEARWSIWSQLITSLPMFICMSIVTLRPDLLLQKRVIGFTYLTQILSMSCTIANQVALMRHWICIYTSNVLLVWARIVEYKDKTSNQVQSPTSRRVQQFCLGLSSMFCPLPRPRNNEHQPFHKARNGPCTIAISQRSNHIDSIHQESSDSVV